MNYYIAVNERTDAPIVLRENDPPITNKKAARAAVAFVASLIARDTEGARTDWIKVGDFPAKIVYIGHRIIATVSVTTTLEGEL